MNFLSHYYFERYAVDAEQVLGGLLPDLLKNVDKSYSFHIHKYDGLFKINSKTEAITAGWKRHVEIDRLFHSSDFFYRHTHQLRLAIENDIADLPIRASFLAHIALELLLDHELIVHEVVHVGRLYEHLDQVDRGVVRAYLQTFEKVDVDRFFIFYDRFIASRYIFGYDKVENLPQALFQICKRVWKFDFTDRHHEELGKRLMKYREEHLGDFFDIYSYLNQRLE